MVDANDLSGRVPAWQLPGAPENRWPVFFALMAAMFLQRAVPLEYVVVPRWPLLLLECSLLVVLAVINPVPLTKSARAGTTATLFVLAAIAAAAHWPAIAVGTLVLIGVLSVRPQRLTRLTRLAAVLTVALLAAITVDNTMSAVVLDYRIVSGQVSNNPAVLLGSTAGVDAAMLAQWATHEEPAIDTPVTAGGSPAAAAGVVRDYRSMHSHSEDDLREAPERAGGIQSRAAQLLGLSARQFAYRWKRLQPDADNEAPSKDRQSVDKDGHRPTKLESRRGEGGP